MSFSMFRIHRYEICKVSLKSPKSCGDYPPHLLQAPIHPKIVSLGCNRTSSLVVSSWWCPVVGEKRWLSRRYETTDLLPMGTAVGTVLIGLSESSFGHNLPPNKSGVNTGVIRSITLCNIGYPFKMHLKPKSREISFVDNLVCSCPFVSKYCTEHEGVTAVLCTKFQNKWTADAGVKDGRGIMFIKYIYEFKWF